ncbi:hypothetical protein E5D57_012169 [Metarhizium anisopliae]|nr:hypothetical protein E5D57_012169 [Metarhizium anisopliae]
MFSSAVSMAPSTEMSPAESEKSVKNEPCYEPAVRVAHKVVQINGGLIPLVVAVGALGVEDVAVLEPNVPRRLVKGHVARDC